MSTTPVSRSSEAPALDAETIEALFELTEGEDDSFVRDLFESFAQTFRDCHAGLRQAHQSNEPELMHSRAHTLKGASSNVGAMQLADMASELQRMGEERDLEGSGPWIEALAQEYDRVLGELEKLFPGFEAA